MHLSLGQLWLKQEVCLFSNRSAFWGSVFPFLFYFLNQFTSVNLPRILSQHPKRIDFLIYLLSFGLSANEYDSFISFSFFSIFFHHQFFIAFIYRRFPSFLFFFFLVFYLDRKEETSFVIISF